MNRKSGLSGARVMILGAGQIGSAVAHAVVNAGATALWAHTKTDGERLIVLDSWRRHFPDIEIGSSYGDIFLPLGPFGGDEISEQQGLSSDRLNEALSDSSRFESRVNVLARAFRPTFVVDATNCATTLGDSANYPELTDLPGSIPEGLADAAFLGTAVAAVRRSVLDVWQMLETADVESYTKVSTTALGGMGLKIPFTHGDSRGAVLSPALWRKLYLSGVHHQLLWALERTIPGRVNVVVPSAFVGFEDGLSSVATVSRKAQTTDIPGVRSGENSVYGLHELTFIASPEQMGVVTKEEIADACIAAINGDKSHELIEGMRSAALPPSTRGHEEWRQRVEALRAAEDELNVQSVTSGNLGPFVSEQLLLTFAILEVAGTVEAAVQADAEELARRIPAVFARDDIAAQITASLPWTDVPASVSDIAGRQRALRRILSRHPDLELATSLQTGALMAHEYAQAQHADAPAPVPALMGD